MQSASSAVDSSTLRASSGRAIASSKFPELPPSPTATSLAITCMHTSRSASHCVGLTLPGMIDEPGSLAGMRSSPRPPRGPDASQRTSSACLASARRAAFSAPCSATSASSPASAANLLGAPVKRQSGQLREPRHRAIAELRVRVQPGADGGAAERELEHARQRELQRALGRRELRSVARRTPARASAAWRPAGACARA